MIIPFNAIKHIITINYKLNLSGSVFTEKKPPGSLVTSVLINWKEADCPLQEIANLYGYIILARYHWTKNICIIKHCAQLGSFWYFLFQFKFLHRDVFYKYNFANTFARISYRYRCPFVNIYQFGTFFLRLLFKRLLPTWRLFQTCLALFLLI